MGLIAIVKLDGTYQILLTGLVLSAYLYVITVLTPPTLVNHVLRLHLDSQMEYVL